MLAANCSSRGSGPGAARPFAVVVLAVSYPELS